MHQRLVETMLYRFRYPRRLEDGCTPFWASVIGKSPEHFARDFSNRGLLRPASDAESLKASSTVGVLKALAKERGLPVSGTKDALVDRLLASTSPPSIPAGLFVLSNEGNSALEEVRQRYEIDRATSRGAAGSKVSDGDLVDALRLIKDYTARWSIDYLLPANPLSIPISDETMLEDAKWILSNVPDLLKKLPTEELAICRMGATLKALSWNDEENLYGHPTGKESDTTELFIDAVRMYAAAADFERERRNWFEMFPSGRGEVMTCSDSKRCDECAKLEGVKFTSGKMPSLPHAKCTSPKGCRCMALWHDE